MDLTMTLEVKQRPARQDQARRGMAWHGPARQHKGCGAITPQQTRKQHRMSG